MVFFTCGSCGSSLKKNQVEKHYKFQCKSCQYVSCMDCSKDFWGNTYETHLKCITEDQKYGGSNFVAKEFKGEKKQEAWTAKIQAVVATTKNMDPQLKTLLNQIIGFDNIPRKKSKFENFLKNSAKIRNPDLVARAWKVFESATKENSNKNCNGDAATQNGTVGDTKESNQLAEKKEDGVTEEHAAPKERLSKEEKRKRKEEKKLKKLQRKAEEEAKSLETVEPGEVGTDVKKIKKEKKKKKEEEDKQNGDKPEVADQGEPEDESVKLENKKKRKVEEVEPEEVVEKGDVKTEMKKNKKKKKKQQNDEEPEAKEMGNSDEPKTETEVKKKKKDKRKQNPEGLVVNGDVPETADLEVNQELTKEQKKEERRKEKLARKEERRRVERENVASEDTTVLNGRSKKKRKHEEKDRDDTDVQLPKKKKKKVCEDMNGAVEEPVNSEEHVCNGINDSKIVEEEVNNSESSVSPFKWKVVIRKALATAPGKRLKITKLRKKVLAEYHSASGGSGDSSVSQSELYALFGQKIKSGKFVIDKEYVQMRC